MCVDVKGQSTDGADVNEQQFVVFKLAGEEFAVKIDEVREVIRWDNVTRIPNTFPYIKGVLNLRGSVIVINDLAMKLGLPSEKTNDDTKILIIDVGDDIVGMAVDSVNEVIRLDIDKIEKTPSMIESNVNHDYIEGIEVMGEKRLITLLNLAKVLDSNDHEQIINVEKQAGKEKSRESEKLKDKLESKKGDVKTNDDVEMSEGKK